MDLNAVFQEDAKVVISPDKMRAWVMLPPPPAGITYTAEAIAQWLPEHDVVFGVDAALVKKAATSGRYHELIEVAHGKEPVAATGESYTLRIDKKPFTGLRGNSDGSLFYDDLSFLQVAEENQILAEVEPAFPGIAGTGVTGEDVAPKPAEKSSVLEGSGFIVTDDGRYYRSPVVSHISMVNNKLIVTPLLRLETLSGDDAPVDFDGNIFVEKDLRPGAVIEATGSIFVAGRAASANIKAGRNVLISGGMLGQSGFSRVEAKENVWSLFFEGAEVVAGNDVSANHLSGCEVKCGGKASILGGRGAIMNTSLYAKNGVIAIDIGTQVGDKSVVAAGMDKELIERFTILEQRITKLGNDVQGLQHSITAYERMNRTRPDKGRNNPDYKEMIAKKSQSLSVLNILTGERTRVKRAMDQFSNVSIVARNNVAPGVTIEIDTRTYSVTRQLHKVKFRRDLEEIKVVMSSGR